MKKILFLALVGLTSLQAIAQNPTGGSTGRGIYGTIQPITKFSMNCYNAQGVAKNVGFDTLVNADTGYVWIGLLNNYNLNVDVLWSTISGTVATANVVFQVATDSATPTSNWRTVTGNTTYCTTCVGASSTTIPGAALHYIAEFPANAFTDQFIRARIIQGGTATSSYYGKITERY